jgi:hypothetical protein
MRSLSLWRPRVDNSVGARPARGTSVKDDWRAWLPEHKAEIFRLYVRQLEIQYNMFSISLDEALQLRRGGRFAKAGQAVCVTPELCSRFAHPLVALLWALGEHSKHHGTVPNAVPLDPANFRSPRGQRSARVSSMLCRFLLTERLQFLNKISTLGEMVVDLTRDFCSAAVEITANAASVAESSWQSVDAAHYDLNTCLREAIVLLKSFLRALPDTELDPFKAAVKVQMCVPPPHILSHSQRFLRHRRLAEIAGE